MPSYGLYVVGMSFDIIVHEHDDKFHAFALMV